MEVVDTDFLVVVNLKKRLIGWGAIVKKHERGRDGHSYISLLTVTATRKDQVAGNSEWKSYILLLLPHVRIGLRKLKVVFPDDFCI